MDIVISYLEDRRGADPRHHGINSNLGIVPFMSGILCSGLRHYHLWAGDDRAAVALTEVAESVYADRHNPVVSKSAPDVDYYSPSLYLRGTDDRTPISHRG